MLPCVKSVFSPVKRNPPLAHHAVERADGADHAVRVLFGEAVQQRAERLKELRVVLLRQLPPGVRQGDAGHASVLGGDLLAQIALALHLLDGAGHAGARNLSSPPDRCGL